MVQVHDLSIGAGPPLSLREGTSFGRALAGGIQTANQVQNMVLKKQEAERRQSQEQRRQEQFDYTVGRAEQQAQEQMAGLKEYQQRAIEEFDDAATPEDESLEMRQRLARMPAGMREGYLNQQIGLRQDHLALQSSKEFGEELDFEMGQGSFALAPQAETIVPQLQEQNAEITQRMLRGEITSQQAAREIDDLKGQARNLQVANAKAEVKQTQRQEAIERMNELYMGAMEAPPENRQALLETMAGVKNGLIDPAKALDQARDALYGRNVGGTTKQADWRTEMPSPGMVAQRLQEAQQLAGLLSDGQGNGQAAPTNQKKVPTAKVNQIRKAAQSRDKEALKKLAADLGLSAAEVREIVSGG